MRLFVIYLHVLNYHLAHRLGLEKGELVDLNISDSPLKSNSTACKIKSPRPNASF